MKTVSSCYKIDTNRFIVTIAITRSIKAQRIEPLKLSTMYVNSQNGKAVDISHVFVIIYSMKLIFLWCHSRLSQECKAIKRRVQESSLTLPWKIKLGYKCPDHCWLNLANSSKGCTRVVWYWDQWHQRCSGLNCRSFWLFTVILPHMMNQNQRFHR